ncbi:MAG: 2OG-Fe(II) oxygenase family protein [Dehalococcoidia bacterium]
MAELQLDNPDRLKFIGHCMMDDKITVVQNWLGTDRAEDIAARMGSIRDWSARICDKDGGPRIIPPQALKDLGVTAEEYARSYPDSLMRLAQGGTMAYLFFVKALREFDPGLFEWFETEFLEMANKLTNEDLNYIEEPQVTMYSSGCFLGQHSDGVGNRRIAFIANFTKNWQPDFGGCLTIQDSGKWSVIEPFFNSLALMDVSAGCNHYVSQVASWVPHNRLAIAGWVGKREH